MSNGPMFPLFILLKIWPNFVWLYKSNGGENFSHSQKKKKKKKKNKIK